MLARSASGGSIVMADGDLRADRCADYLAPVCGDGRATQHPNKKIAAPAKNAPPTSARMMTTRPLNCASVGSDARCTWVATTSGRFIGKSGAQ